MHPEIRKRQKLRRVVVQPRDHHRENFGRREKRGDDGESPAARTREKLRVVAIDLVPDTHAEDLPVDRNTRRGVPSRRRID